MSGPELTAVLTTLVSPVAALTGVWLTAQLTGKQRQREQEERFRSEALAALGKFTAVVVDADPRLVTSGDLREYADPAAAIAGLYERWRTAREPMLLIFVSHPSAEVRRLAFDLQAQLELALRFTDDAIRKGAPLDLARHRYDLVQKNLLRMGELLSGVKWS